jgi:hypothetical protein
MKKKWEYNGRLYRLFTGFEQGCDSVRTEVKYNILTEFGIPMKLVRKLTRV